MMSICASKFAVIAFSVSFHTMTMHIATMIENFSRTVNGTERFPQSHTATNERPVQVKSMMFKIPDCRSCFLNVTYVPMLMPVPSKKMNQVVTGGVVSFFRTFEMNRTTNPISMIATSQIHISLITIASVYI